MFWGIDAQRCITYFMSCPEGGPGHARRLVLKAPCNRRVEVPVYDRIIAPHVAYMILCICSLALPEAGRNAAGVQRRRSFSQAALLAS